MKGYGAAGYFLYHYLDMSTMILICFLWYTFGSFQDPFFLTAQVWPLNFITISILSSFGTLMGVKFLFFICIFHTFTFKEVHGS